MLCLGWAMNWEELKNDMHLAYLARSIPARIILVYFQIVRFEKSLRSVHLEQPKVDMDIILPKERIEIEVDEQFDPLFAKSKPLLQHLEQLLLSELPPTLSTLANSPLNS